MDNVGLLSRPAVRRGRGGEDLIMRVKLKVLQGSRAQEEIDVVGSRFFIGRSHDCHLRPKSAAVSRQHCVLLVSDSDVTVHDLNSKNGTLVNGHRVSGHQPLHAGDLLRVGPLEFQLLIQRDLPSLPPTVSPRDLEEATSSSDTAYRPASSGGARLMDEETSDAALETSDEPEEPRKVEPPQPAPRPQEKDRGRE